MRFYPFIKRNKKKTRFVFPVKDLKTTRASLGVNPLQTYNPVGLTTVPADTVVTHGGMGYVGGDTVEFTYDFGTKVAGSVAECPCKIYRRYGATIGTPTDSWAEWVDQASIDFLKSQDNTSLHAEQISTNYAQIMVEIDLTQGVCNPYFGGSNAAMKSASKAVYVDLWAKAKGSNAGVATDGVISALRYNSSSWSGSATASNNTSSIAKLSYSATAGTNMFIDANNKVYVIIYATYPGDGTIPSSIDLDFIQVRIQFTKPKDTAQSKTVTIPQNGKFALVIKGYAPNYPYNISASGEAIANLVKDNNNRIGVWYSDSADKFQVSKVYGGSPYHLYTTVQTFNKLQAYNLILQQNAIEKTLYMLKNNGTLEKVTDADANPIIGQVTLQLFNYNNSVYYGEGFAESVNFYPNKNYDDASALAELQSVSELLDLSKIVLNSSAQIVDGNIVLTSSEVGNTNASDIFIPVLPNNRYNLKVNISGSVGGRVTVEHRYNNIITVAASAYSSAQVNLDIITGATTNILRINFNKSSTATGAFTFSNISLKLKM